MWHGESTFLDIVDLDRDIDQEQEHDNRGKV